MNRFPGYACVLVFLLVACGDDNPGGPSRLPYTLAEAFPNLTFARPTNIVSAGDGTDRIFVTEQVGRILVFPNDPAAAAATEFLNISSEVQAPTNSEMGLIGLVFHPKYETNGYFFVHYSSGTPTARLGRVSRFSVSTLDPNAADPASEKILLEFADAYPNHNGGAMVFGADGYLYIAIGDGGGAGDTDDNAQDRSKIFGKILRVDVDQNINTPPYHGIPPDNPYVGNPDGYREDIWAYGLRNPWRISYDVPGDLLVAGDVGQDTWEEIDLIEKGGNYGWDCREGLVPYDQGEDPSSPLCATASGLVNPIFVYPHSEGESITGGYVYRGSALPSLTGRYVYADFTSGRIWALTLASGKNDLVNDTSLFISTLGVDENDELLVAGYFADGTPTGLYRIVEDQVFP